MNPFKRAYFPKYPKYTNELCKLSCILGALCIVTMFLGTHRLITVSLLSLQTVLLAIMLYRIKSYHGRE